MSLRGSGLSYAEIAERMKITVGCVARLLHNARKDGLSTPLDGRWAHRLPADLLVDKRGYRWRKP